MHAMVDGQDQLSTLKQLIKETPSGSVAFHLSSDPLPMEELIQELLTNGHRGKIEIEPSQEVVLTWHSEPPSSLHSVFSLPKCAKGVQTKSAVTYALNQGRLGDKLLVYFHAKWIAYQYNLPFLYTPFDQAELFHLSIRDQELSSDFQFENVVRIGHLDQIDLFGPATLYAIPFFPETLFMREMRRRFDRPYFRVDWTDPQFRKEMIACLTPREKVKTIKLPSNCMTVGVHVRRGEGVDGEAVFQTFPLKFPNDAYYVRQLETIAKIFKDKSIYVHVFTDVLHPLQIVEALKSKLRGYPLKFGCRILGNGPGVHILDDFCSMQKCDCLIISQSNFSLLASKLRDYAIVIMPTHATQINGQYEIDGIEIAFNPALKTP